MGNCKQAPIKGINIYICLYMYMKKYIKNKIPIDIQMNQINLHFNTCKQITIIYVVKIKPNLILINEIKWDSVWNKCISTDEEL